MSPGAVQVYRPPGVCFSEAVIEHKETSTFWGDGSTSEVEPGMNHILLSCPILPSRRFYYPWLAGENALAHVAASSCL